MSLKDKPFNIKSIDDIYNYVEVESKYNPNEKDVIRPENINVLKDNESEIVLLMSYKKKNPSRSATPSPRHPPKNGDQRQKPETCQRRLASTINYLTKGIVSDDNVVKDDSLEENIRGIFNNSQNPCFKPPHTNIDEIRSTDTLTAHQIRKITDNSRTSNNFDEKVLKPLTTHSQVMHNHTKTRIPLPQRLNSREKNKPQQPTSSVKPAVKPPMNKIPVKQKYFAVCIPNKPSQKYDKETQFQSLRYFNPSLEEFKKPDSTEIVVVPVNLVAKKGDQKLTADSASMTNDHGPKIELTLEELHTIVRLVKERNII